jgi:DNA-binding CsgD family transcriptional regulator
MQQLVGRLAALDPEASESLKVITYFDALVHGHASIDMLLRGAAILSGCAAGCVGAGISRRVAPAGTGGTTSGAAAATASPSGGPGVPSAGDWPQHRVGSDGRVWIERVGVAHANDEMILERLAFGVEVAFDRTPRGMVRRAMESIIDRDETADDRRAAAQRLSLGQKNLYRVVAAPARDGVTEPDIAIETPVGRVRVGIRPDVADAAGWPARSGVGLARTPDRLPESWASALIALRLSSEREPVLRADDLGTLLVLASGLDATTHDSPDLAGLQALLVAHPRCRELLESVVQHDSLRAVALELGLHHSTVQSRVADYAQELGFELRSATGRVRLSLALAHLRLVTTRFD